jgi:putative hydrolase of the HAD superfamily
MSEKGEADYRKLIKHLDIQPEEFVMIGNSLKSDVLPVLNIGGHGVHVPYHVTWAHEHIEHHIEHENFRQVQQIRESFLSCFHTGEINRKCIHTKTCLVVRIST